MPPKKIYASADIFVFPSTTETFGNVILEAYASGLPVVTVNKGGVADLVQDGRTGFIAEANHTVDIAQKVAILLNNPDLRRQYTNQAQEYARNFSWDEINNQLLVNYQELIQSHRHLGSN